MSTKKYCQTFVLAHQALQVPPVHQAHQVLLVHLALLAHQVLQVLLVHQAAVQVHHRAAQVHRQAVPAQAGIITFRKWSILES